jgi:hypothetical protein
VHTAAPYNPTDGARVAQRRASDLGAAVRIWLHSPYRRVKGRGEHRVDDADRDIRLLVWDDWEVADSATPDHELQIGVEQE